MKIRRLLLCLLALLLLPSCWDIKDLQTLNYITSIGLDYQDGKYIIHAQMLDFSSIAKQESGKTSTPPSVYVGRGVGDSINLAMNDLYKTAQQESQFSHLSSIIFSEGFLRDGITRAADTLFRFREIRHTPWLYGTESSMDEIYNSNAFFNLTTLNTILAEPIELYRQRSTIAPMQLVNFVAQFREPGKTILLPSIYVDKKQWKHNEKPEKKLGVNGVYAIHNLKYLGKIDRKEIEGVRWQEKRMDRTPLQIEKNGKTMAVISVSRVNADIHPVNTPDKEHPRFAFDLKYTASVMEALMPTTETELTEMGIEKIKKEIEQTYKMALKKNIDVYSLEHVLYREDYALWKQLHDEDRFKLTEDSIESININFKIRDSGMDRIEKLEMPPEY